MTADQLSPKHEQRLNDSTPHESGEPSSLWKAAYENAGYIAAGAAVAAAGVGLAFATRGLAAELSPFVARNVLLVEDGPLGAAMEATLKGNSWLSRLAAPNVTRVSGITSIEPFTAQAPNGASIALNPAQFDVALVNGASMSGAVNPVALTAKLSEHNVTTIATSLATKMNEEMLANGASVAVPKGTVLPALLDKTLNLKTAVMNPGRLQANIVELTEQLKVEGNPLRKLAKETLLKHMQT
jgi:hypothetical protein